VTPRLVVNPPSDAEFVAFAHRIAEPGEVSTDDFERRLRVEYPGAVVRARELASEPILIWYVYRDGRWSPSGAPWDATPGGPSDG